MLHPCQRSAVLFFAFYLFVCSFFTTVPVPAYIFFSTVWWFISFYLAKVIVGLFARKS